MTALRTANPEYALEVDEMMLDYTMYRTIEKYLELLDKILASADDSVNEDDPFPGFHFAAGEGIQVGDGDKTKLQKEVETICLVHNSLAIRFRIAHPNAIPSPSRDCNTKILEFLVLLGYWLPRSSRTRVGPGTHWQWPYESSFERRHFQWPADLPSALLDDIERERVLQTLLRRNWLGIRYESENEQQLLDEQEEKRSTPRSHKRRRIDYDDHYDMDEGDLLNDRGSIASEQSNRPSTDLLDPPNQEAPCLTAGISTGGKSNRRLKPAPKMYGGRVNGGLFMLNLFDLVPRFMDLSGIMSEVLGDVNENWIILALRFMQQSALERLQNIPEDRLTKPSDAPSVSIREDFGARTWIEECFAWGSLSTPPSTTSLARIKQELRYLTPNNAQEAQIRTVNTYTDRFLLERLHAEDAVCAMLNPNIDRANPDPVSRLHEAPVEDATAEHTKWTTGRQTLLDTLLDMNIIQVHGSAEFESFRRPVRELCVQNPIRPFLTDLLSFVKDLWRANNQNDPLGKPILVQIEEGRIDGVSAEDFDEFLVRVGLRKVAVHGVDGSVVGTTFKWR